MKNLILSLSFLLMGTFLFSQSEETKPSLDFDIDPDAYSFLLSRLDGKWNTKVGGAFLVPVYQRPQFEINVSIGGFVNIHDFSEDQFFSWEIWRGNFGGTTSMTFKNIDWLPANNRFTFSFTYSHESQHASNVFRYVQEFMTIRPEAFDNGSLRSFEYLKFGGEYFYPFFKDKLQFSFKLGYKYFPEPLLSSTRKILQHSIFTAFGLEWNIKKAWFAYSKVYMENMQNSFDSAQWNYRTNISQKTFTHRIAETGIAFVNKKEQSIGAFLFYSNSYGRGLDFITKTKALGVGLRYFL